MRCSCARSRPRRHSPAARRRRPSRRVPLTLRYAFWGNPDAIGVERDIINAFQAKNGAITVEPVVSGYGDYHTMLLTRLAGGNAPDVMRVDSYYFFDFLQVNALRSIDDLVTRDKIDTAIYYQQGIQEASSNGKLYGLPWATSGLYMIINLKMLEAVGLKAPSLDWTWDDAEAIAKKVTTGSGADAKFGFAFNTTSLSSVLPYVWAEGGDLFTPDRKKFALNEPAAIRGLERLVRQYKEGLMPQDTITANADAMTRWFVNDRVAMRLGSVAEVLSTQKVEGTRFEAWSQPGGPGRKRTTVYKSNLVGIATPSKLVEPSWTFLKFLRGPSGEGETLYMQAKRMAPTMADDKYWALYADPTKYPKLIGPNSKAIADSYGSLLPLRPGWLEIEQMVLPAVQQAMTGAKTAKAAMDEIAPRVQAVLDRTK